jgi:hypothetical protein
MGQLGSDEVGSRWPKKEFVFNSLFEFGRLVGDTGWFSV